jgi:hypothetical protein
MAEDVEGSVSHGGESRSEEDHVEEFQFGWNEDSVDLEFKTGHIKYETHLSETFKLQYKNVFL